MVHGDRPSTGDSFLAANGISIPWTGFASVWRSGDRQVGQGDSPLTAASTQKLRVLFVDDEPAIRDVMKLELPRMGHDVVMCEDGHAALKALEKQAFDAAIVDLRMPG